MTDPRLKPSLRYYDGARPDLLDWLGGRYSRVLEIGCGRGGNARWFREHGATWITGIDLDAPSASDALARFDQVLIGDVTDLLEQLDGQYDLIVCADVLEHLADPWTVVSRLRGLATPGGTIVASIPNIRFFRAVWEIAVGHGFQYAPEGIFDRTHLRFFTRTTIVDLVEQAGWRLQHLEPSPSHRFGRLRAAVEILTARRSREWLTYQWFIAATCSDAPANSDQPDT